MTQQHSITRELYTILRKFRTITTPRIRRRRMTGTKVRHVKSLTGRLVVLFLHLRANKDLTWKQKNNRLLCFSCCGGGGGGGAAATPFPPPTMKRREEEGG